jgi:predicted nucleic acid-binding protein
MEATWPAVDCSGGLTQQGDLERKAIVILNVFTDSSALSKRYVQEPGTGRLEEILAEASSLGISRICLTEIISALCRRRREGSLSKDQYLKAKQALFTDIIDATVVNLTDEVILRAVGLLERWPLRSSDSLHIACAAEWQADLFVSADEQQCKAARVYGLRVEKL